MVSDAIWTFNQGLPLASVAFAASLPRTYRMDDRFVLKLVFLCLSSPLMVRILRRNSFFWTRFCALLPPRLNEHGLVGGSGLAPPQSFPSVCFFKSWRGAFIFVFLFFLLYPPPRYSPSRAKGGCVLRPHARFFPFLSSPLNLGH